MDLDFDIYDLCDFSSSDVQTNTTSKSKYVKDGKPIEYDNMTIEYYRSLRERKMDPVTLEVVSPETGFEFPFEWDPYTGERRDIKDPYGSFWFDPHSLCYLIYKNKLRMLWKSETDEAGGMFQGYYDACVGAGDDMKIVSRGSYIECYPFRLPVIDCYIPNDADHSIITMGPKLTNSEIRKIDELVKLKGHMSYLSKFNFNKKGKIPELTKIKFYYDQAISKEPDISEYVSEHDMSTISKSTLEELRNRANRVAVDRLKVM